MNRTWWTHLQTIAPQALGACTTRFAQKYPSDWRGRIQELGEVERYFFEMHKLEIHFSHTAGGALPYGFRIGGKGYKVQRLRQYTSADEARWAALSLAFQLIEADLRRVSYVKPELHQPIRRQVKDEKKNLVQEDWRKQISVSSAAPPRAA